MPSTGYYLRVRKDAMHTVIVHRTTSPTAHYSGLGTDHNSSRSGGFKLEALRVQLLRPFVILRLVGLFFPSQIAVESPSWNRNRLVLPVLVKLIGITLLPVPL